VRTPAKQVVTAAHREGHIGADMHTVAHGGPTLKQSVLEGLYPVAETSCWSRGIV